MIHRGSRMISHTVRGVTWCHPAIPLPECSIITLVRTPFRGITPFTLLSSTSISFIFVIDLPPLTVTSSLPGTEDPGIIINHHVAAP